MNYKLLLLSLWLLPISLFAANNDVLTTQTKNSVSQNTVMNTTHLSIAKAWGLTETEWRHYLLLMQGPSGHYYKNLSPPDVLGIEADSAEELRHFAEVAAKLEHDKLERELRFNVAFHEAATRLYATEPLIQPFDVTPFTPIPKN